MTALCMMPSALASFDFSPPPAIVASIDAARNSIELSRTDQVVVPRGRALDAPMALNVVNHIRLRVHGQTVLRPVVLDSDVLDDTDD